jgi:hypothetical protein
MQRIFIANYFLRLCDSVSLNKGDARMHDATAINGLTLLQPEHLGTNYHVNRGSLP